MGVQLSHAHDAVKMGSNSSKILSSNFLVILLNSYVCETLNDYGFRGKEVMVNVIDIVRLKNTGDWESIGSTVW